jgi:hypothetical protein
VTSVLFDNSIKWWERGGGGVVVEGGRGHRSDRRSKENRKESGIRIHSRVKREEQQGRVRGKRRGGRRSWFGSQRESFEMTCDNFRKFFGDMGTKKFNEGN